MEKTYKILKTVLWMLCVVALILGVCRLAQTLGSRQPLPAVTEQTAAATEAAAQPAPEITVYDKEGNAHKLSDYQGKPVILNFWASWCGPCKSEMPEFEAAYLKYGDQIHFLMVNLTDGVQETVEAASAFLEEAGYTFPVYFDTDLDAAMGYAVNAIPVTYFIDANGALIGGQQGMLSAEMLQQGIDILLAE